MATRFCENCGAAVNEGSQFCESCGATVGAQAAQPQQSAPAPAPAPAPSQPQAPQPNYQAQPAQSQGLLNQKVLIAVVGVVAVAVISFGAWQFLGKKEPPKKEDQTASASLKQNSGAPEPTVTVTQDGDAFLGRWFPEDTTGADTSNNILTFSRQGSKIVGVSTQDPNGRVELVSAAGAKLSGEYIDSKGDRTPVTAEMLSDGQKMILTLMPPASEPDTVILWKVKEGEAPSVKGLSEGGSVTPEPVNQDKAVEIVAALPEVDKFCRQLDAAGKRAMLDPSEEDSNTWMVHVYEVVDDGDGMSHTATFGWFKVDKKTGKVSPGME